VYTLRRAETEDDFKQVKRLWTVHARLMRTKVPERTDLDVGFIECAFRGDDLVATMRHHDWDGMQMYSIDSIYVKPGEMTYYAALPGQNNPISPLIDHIVGAREAAGQFTWWYSRAIAPGYTKMHRNGYSFMGASRLGHRYQKFLMEIVPAGQRSTVTTHDTLLGARTYDKDVMVVMCCLKNEHRQPALQLGDEVEYF